MPDKCLRILFLSAWCPYPLDNGSRIRQYYLLRHLTARHEVTLFTFLPNEEWRASLPVLETFCSKVVGVPARPFHPRSLQALAGLFSPFPRMVTATFSREMHNRIAREMEESRYDVFITGDIGQALYGTAAKAKVAILDDVEAANLYDLIQCGETWQIRGRHSLTRLKYERFVRNVLRHYNGCTVVSEKEKDLLRPLVAPQFPVAVIPNGVDTRLNLPGLADPKPDSLVFAGSLLYSANWEAVDWFLRDVYPLVRAEVPEVTLTVIGRHNGTMPGTLPSPENVTFAGFVQDVRPYVAGSVVSIVPLRQGAGTRLKVMEAMSLGVPVVSTSKGIEGLEVTPSQEALVADEPRAFAEAVVRVLCDEALRKKLTSNARRLVETRYDWRGIGAQWEDWIQELVMAKEGAI